MVINKQAYFFIGLVFGLLIYYWFLLPKPTNTVRIVETVRTDTVYVHEFDTIVLTKKEIKHNFLRDTVYLGVDMPINDFKASYPHVYGNIDISGQLIGEMLYMGLKTDFRIPTVTNTINRTETIIKKPRGVYAGGLVISNLSAGVGGIYVFDRNLIQYSYFPEDKSHAVGYYRRIF
jgi:hypothetical protein